MTDQETRIAVAEECGWVRIDDDGWWESPCGFPNLTVPDYPNDLNAMYAAEAGLVGHEMIAYQATLSAVCPKNPHVSCWDIIHTTPRQRAEAFLRVKGKWRES